MSAKDQQNDNHTGRHHKWRNRMKDWFLLPCSHVPKRPEGITTEELSHHNGQGTVTDPTTGHRVKASCWIAVDGFVYDVTQFMPFHPGGELIFKDVLGRDCSWEFHHNHLAFKINEATPELLVGPLVQEVVSLTTSAECSGSGSRLASGGAAMPMAVGKGNGGKNNKKRNDGSDDDSDDDDDDYANNNSNNNNDEKQELDEEERAALVDLFQSLLGDNKAIKCLSELQFHNFLAASGVTDEEKDLTLKRLKELRPNAAEAGIDIETFISLF